MTGSSSTSLHIANMTKNAIDLATANRPQKVVQHTNEFDTTSSLYPNGYNYDDAIPSVCEFYADVTTPMIACISIALVVWLIIVLIFYRKINYAFKSTPARLLGRTIIMNSAYPIVATAAVASLLVPSAMVIADSVCHLTFAVLAYQYFCIAVDYAGGEKHLVELANKTDAFTMRKPPCCCCLPFLKPSPLTRKNLNNVRLLVLQLPIIQCIIVVALNIVNVEQKSLYTAYLQYFAPFMVCSILVGVWGLNITVGLLRPLLPDHYILGKFLAIQLVLILCKLQPTIFHQIVRAIEFETPSYPLSPKVYANAAVQLLILFEMLILAVWASVMYRAPSKQATTIVE